MTTRATTTSRLLATSVENARLPRGGRAFFVRIVLRLSDADAVKGRANRLFAQVPFAEYWNPNVRKCLTLHIGSHIHLMYRKASVISCGQKRADLHEGRPQEFLLVRDQAGRSAGTPRGQIDLRRSHARAQRAQQELIFPLVRGLWGGRRRGASPQEARTASKVVDAFQARRRFSTCAI